MRVSFYTLGCKVNQNETGALEQLFLRPGLYPRGGRRSGGCLRGEQLHRDRRGRQEEPPVAAAGQAPEPRRGDGDGRVLSPGVPRGGRRAGRSGRGGGQRGPRRHAGGHSESAGQRRAVVDIRAHEKGERFEELPMENFEGHTRAFIKVQDGCDRRCAYCVIPGPGARAAAAARRAWCRS